MPTPAYIEEVEIAESETLEENEDSGSLAEIIERQRLEFIRQVYESKAHYDRTGLHLTWDEVSDWMRRLGTPEETEMPQCHT